MAASNVPSHPRLQECLAQDAGSRFCSIHQILLGNILNSLQALIAAVAKHFGESRAAATLRYNDFPQTEVLGTADRVLGFMLLGYTGRYRPLAL